MDMSLFLMLLLSGLLYSASGLWKEYHYINIKMSWSEAQSYCRERFADLATVNSVRDVNSMMDLVNDGYSGSVWIGLKRETPGLWRWSMRNEILTSIAHWSPGEPTGDGECVFYSDELLYDFPCTFHLNFLCYNESTGYVKVNLSKTWRDAQRYCRWFHTDLASIRSSDEEDQIDSLVDDKKYLWIGLFFDSWVWSDQLSLFRNWAGNYKYHTFHYGDCVAMLTTDSGKWIQDSCDHQHHFICHGEEKSVVKQIVRLNLSHDGEYSLNDPSVQTAILNKISEKLKSLGLEGYKNISWKKDEDGDLFHLRKQ